MSLEDSFKKKSEDYPRNPHKDPYSEYFKKKPEKKPEFKYKKNTCNCSFCNHTNFQPGVSIKAGKISIDRSKFDADLKFELDVEDIQLEAYDILIAKQKDYGPDNINKSPGGAMNGLTVRLYDKIARLNNLTQNNKKPEFESLRDTFIDIMNYATIGIMLLDKTFPESK